MPKKKKNPDDILVLVAGKVPKPVKSGLETILEHRKLTESAYVREVVEKQVKRDLKSLAAV